MNTTIRPTHLPVREYFSRVSRMVVVGFAETKIAALLGVQLTTLKRFFARALQLRDVKPNQSNSRTNEKESYMTDPPPPGSIIICGPNGQEIIT